MTPRDIGPRFLTAARAPILSPGRVLKIIQANPGLTPYELRRDFGTQANTICRRFLLPASIATSGNNSRTGRNGNPRRIRTTGKVTVRDGRYYAIAPPEPSTFGPHPKNDPTGMNPLFNPAVQPQPATRQRPPLHPSKTKPNDPKHPDETHRTHQQPTPQHDQVDSSGQEGSP